MPSADGTEGLSDRDSTSKDGSDPDYQQPGLGFFRCLWMRTGCAWNDSSPSCRGCAGVSNPCPNRSSICGTSTAQWAQPNRSNYEGSLSNWSTAAAASFSSFIRIAMFGWKPSRFLQSRRSKSWASSLVSGPFPRYWPLVIGSAGRMAVKELVARMARQRIDCGSCCGS